MSSSTAEGLNFRLRQPPSSFEGCWYFPALLVLEGAQGRLLAIPVISILCSRSFFWFLHQGVQSGYFRALEAVSVSPDALALIVSWVCGHQVVGRRFPETKTGFGQVVHLKELILLRLEGHRSFEIVVHQCGVPAVGRGLQ